MLIPYNFLGNRTCRVAVELNQFDLPRMRQRLDGTPSARQTNAIRQGVPNVPR